MAEHIEICESNGTVENPLKVPTAATMCGNNDNLFLRTVLTFKSSLPEPVK